MLLLLLLLICSKIIGKKRKIGRVGISLVRPSEYRVQREQRVCFSEASFTLRTESKEERELKFWGMNMMQIHIACSHHHHHHYHLHHHHHHHHHPVIIIIVITVGFVVNISFIIKITYWSCSYLTLNLQCKQCIAFERISF